MTDKPRPPMVHHLFQAKQQSLDAQLRDVRIATAQLEMAERFPHQTVTWAMAEEYVDLITRIRR